ncbi:D-alanyl-D-alanine carboxypeptidase family protein [Methylocapsa sp. S129]|uniref:D-alanyl-D-alanine carboxypeptidase family protein n=1 Tax=Methylocapsa sp. S129 TaxID=1641869 RepID=UPI001FEE16CE|nr:D-alanyl-D-alanine carboxypeptidase family protein [Methylocapsa sp. S129]
MQFGPMRRAKQITLLGLAVALIASPSLANPTLVIDADSGQVLIESQPTANWYPASLTKLMTVYVALQAVRAGRVTMDTPFVVSSRAANMPPSKMGFRPGVQVTLDNALKMLMVKSPNDVAVTVAEGVSGSVEAFAGEMNAAAAHLGMRESHFVNPNGLPDARQMSSARDMAMVARALLKEFPEENDIFGIGALQLGDQIIPTHNGLIGHYPGADGMKTGFTCAAGFNVVASATHGGRRLIAVVLGSSSARARTAQAEALFDRAFAQWGGGLGTVESLPSPGVNAAPDMHQEICSGRGRAAMIAGEEEEFTAPIAAAGGRGGMGNASVYAASAGAAPAAATRSLAAIEPVHFDPVPVFIGPKPGWTGPVMAARTSDAPSQKAAANPTATPAEASAYAPSDKPQVLDKDETPALNAATAPMALQGALKPGPAKPLNAPAGKRPPTKLAQQGKPKTGAAVHPGAAKPALKAVTDPAPAR